MLIDFFFTLRRYKVPVTIRELMDLVAAMRKRVVYADVDDFYLLSRACLVKDEKHYDKFDRAFGAYFKGLEDLHGMIEALIPDDWLRREFEKSLTPEELEKIESMGGLERLIEEFKKAREEAEQGDQDGDGEQGEGEQGRGENEGQGGEGPRGSGGKKGKGKKKKGKKAWDRRQYKNLDDSVELGTRNIKVALRRLRRFARAGKDVELDMDDTIRSTAHNGGLLDIRMRPERKNTVKVLCFFDVGGSMDAHVRICEELFSAAKTEFKHMEYFYFHNFIYESVWKNNFRRTSERTSTLDVLHKYGADYKVVFVGDATMAPYEITQPGGSVEHWNEEAGYVWMQRFMEKYKKLIWINPYPKDTWGYTTSTGIVRELVEDRMYPLTLSGLEEGMKFLAK